MTLYTTMRLIDYDAQTGIFTYQDQYGVQHCLTAEQLDAMVQA